MGSQHISPARSGWKEKEKKEKCSLCLGKKESDPFPSYISHSRTTLPQSKHLQGLWERRTLTAHGSSVITFSFSFLSDFHARECQFFLLLLLFRPWHAHAVFLEEESKKEISENSTTGERAWRERALHIVVVVAFISPSLMAIEKSFLLMAFFNASTKCYDRSR